MTTSVTEVPPPRGWRARIDSHDRLSHDAIENLGYDWSRVADPAIEPKPPLVVFWPETTEEVARAVEQAAAAGERLLVRGNAHSSNGLVTADRAWVLVTTRLTGLVDFDESAELATVRAGTITADLDDYLGERGFGLPVCGDHNHITVGGFAAVGGVGMTGHAYGLFVDTVEAIEYVDWSGQVRRASRTAEPDDLYRLLCGTGQYGVITELTVRVVRIQKHTTMLELQQTAAPDFEAWLAALDPLMADSGDAVMLRGLWTDFTRGPIRIGRGTINRYQAADPSVAKGPGTTVGWGLRHGIAYFSGRVPRPADLALRQLALIGGMRQPRYTTYHYAEHLLDQMLDFMTEPCRWFITWVPLESWREVASQQFELVTGLRGEHGCFSFITLDIRQIRSPYLAHGGAEDRFVEILFFVGIKPSRLTPAVVEDLVQRMDEGCAAHGAYRYMHTLTVRDEALRRQIDANTYWAERAAPQRPLAPA